MRVHILQTGSLREAGPQTARRGTAARFTECEGLQPNRGIL